MAIRYEWQILNASKVETATEYLDDAISYLESAIEFIKTGKGKSGYDVFHTDQGNTIPTQADTLIKSLESLITSITNLKAAVISKAGTIQRAERAEYNEYLEEQREKENGYTASDFYRV